MGGFASAFAPAMEAMLEYRVALGFSATALGGALARFDRYCAGRHPGERALTKELVFAWLGSRAADPRAGVNGDACAIRQFAGYLEAIGWDAYVLPEGFYPIKGASAPYVFTDDELAALFRAIDSIPRRAGSTEPDVAPVLFRMIYTCGLRPNEGRELRRENVDLRTGEVYVTNTKRKKDRVVVMSGDMASLCAGYALGGKAPGSGYLFPRRDGLAYTGAQVDRLFKACWARANPGVADPPRVRTYDLRHRFASARLNRWLDEGADLGNKLPYLRAYMGHDDLSETAHYIHILPGNLVKSAGVDWPALDSILPGVTAWGT
jgi:integrase